MILYLTDYKVYYVMFSWPTNNLILCGCTTLSINTDTHRETAMLTKIKKFFHMVWKNIEETQMARAQTALKNSNWSRIE
jgi:hypothetical protein